MSNSLLSALPLADALRCSSRAADPIALNVQAAARLYCKEQERILISCISMSSSPLHLTGNSNEGGIAAHHRTTRRAKRDVHAATSSQELFSPASSSATSIANTMADYTIVILFNIIMLFAAATSRALSAMLGNTAIGSVPSFPWKTTSSCKRFLWNKHISRNN